MIGGTSPNVNPYPHNASDYGDGSCHKAPYGQGQQYGSSYDAPYGNDRLLDETYQTGGPWAGGP